MALSQLRGLKGAQRGVNEKSVKIDIHCLMQLLE